MALVVGGKYERAFRAIYEEPEPGPMPLRVRLYAMFFPLSWTRKVVRATQASIAIRLLEYEDAERGQ